jgi:hypothetical protein
VQLSTCIRYQRIAILGLKLTTDSSTGCSSRFRSTPSRLPALEGFQGVLDGSCILFEVHQEFMEQAQRGFGEVEETRVCCEISDMAIGAIKQVSGSTTARCGVSYLKALVTKDHRCIGSECYMSQ